MSTPTTSQSSTVLKGKIAIVTGGAKGYGSGIARALQDRGATVWVTGRDYVALKRFSESTGIRSIVADVTRGADWDRLFESVVSAHDGLDILINNAGAGIAISPVAEQTDEQILASINTNLTGVILGCRRAVPLLARRGGSTIVNISSVCASHAWPGFAVYSAAKAGLGQFGKSLYLELRSSGTRVTTVIPSWGNTEFADAANVQGHDEATLKKCIQPIELGNMVADLCALPNHLFVQDVTLWPTVQEVTPL